jgi:hypothetical protein
MENKPPNCWKGFLLGMLGSVAGLGAMQLYWKHAAPWVSEKISSFSKKEENAQSQPHPNDYVDISIYGPQYEEGESSTDALGRILYRTVAGKSLRSKEGQNILSNLVHWLFGMIQGGLYGASRAHVSQGLDLVGGGVFGTGLWFFWDELIVPLLGLQKGPAAVTFAQHLNRLGAHVSYGWSTAVITQLLRKFL